MDIGFIGLGNMGQPMARRLIEAGHKLVVYDTSGQMMSRRGRAPSAEKTRRRYAFAASRLGR